MTNQLVSHLTLISLRISFFLGCRRYLQQHFELKPLLIQQNQPHQKTPKPQTTESTTEPSTPTQPYSFSNLNHQQLISPSISTLIFCCSFCEGSLLFSIVILGSWLNPQLSRILQLGLPLQSKLTICQKNIQGSKS
jgi:hypothetical protein